jgi:mono/diheme cytochrome c family protein
MGASAAASAAETQVERGNYLVTLAGCRTCHTPGVLLGKPDLTRILAGSDIGFGIPGVGVFVGGNLTPDKETGLGDWTTEQIIAAITKGVMPNGRKLFVVMPWPDYAHLSSEDAEAIAAYLNSLAPIKNAAPGPTHGGSVDAGLRDRARRRLRQDASTEVTSSALSTNRRGCFETVVSRN